jgi:hypothetical protein
MRKFLTMLLIAGTAVSALADPVVYECRIDRRGNVKLSDGMRAQLEMMERFAIDADARRACLLGVPACSPFFGTLTVPQKEDRISGGGARVAVSKPITLVYLPDRSEAVMTFDTSQVTTRQDGWSATDLRVVIP